MLFEYTDDVIQSVAILLKDFCCVTVMFWSVQSVSHHGEASQGSQRLQ